MCSKARHRASSATGAKTPVVFVALMLLTVLTSCGQSAERQGELDESEPNTSGPTTVVKKEPAYDPGELAGTEWMLTSLNGHDLIEDSAITLDFDDGVGGNAGCNSYGTYKLETDGGVFKVSDLLSTGTGCWRDVGRQEGMYLRTLEKAATYQREGDRLEIRNAAGETTLVYAQRTQYHSDPADLVGTKWMLHSTNGRLPLKGSTPTLSFGSGRRYSGYDGCRHFTGTYYADADDISFPNVSMEESDCMKPDIPVGYEGAPGGFPPDGDYRLSEGRLEIFTTPNQGANVYVPLREGVNAGAIEAAWKLEKLVEKGRSRPVLSGTQITLTFDRGTLRESGKVDGSAGCNHYTADYTTRGDAVIFESLAVTEMACQTPAGVMEQEKRYLDFLEDVNGYYQKVDGRLHLAVTDQRELVFR